MPTAEELYQKRAMGRLFQRIEDLEGMMQQMRGGDLVGKIDDADKVDDKHAVDLKHGVSTDEDTAIKVKIGSFASQASTGNKSITGVGFKPRYVDFWIVIAGSTEIRVGRGQMDYNGNQNAISWAGKDTNQRTYVSVGKCFEIRYASTGVLQVSAVYVSMDSDGFTINYIVGLSGSYTIIYKAVR